MNSDFEKAKLKYTFNVDILTIFKNIYLLALLVGFFSAVPFVTSLSNGFVEFDDPALVYANPLVTNFSLAKTFTTKNAEDYLPLVTVSFAIENYFFGLDPFYYHTTNLIFHVLNSILVFILLLSIFPELATVAFISALFFGIHPLHVESVAWISQRKDMLCTFFSLISVWSYLQISTRNRNFLVLSLICFVLALFSKFMAVTVPILILLISRYKKEKIKKSVLITIPYVIPMTIFAVIHLQLHNSPGQSKVGQFSLLGGLENGFNATAFYVSKAIVPIGLGAFYEKNVAVATLLDYALLLGIVILIAVTALRYKAARSAILLLSAFFFVSIAPVLQIVPFGNKFIFADRFMYLPSIGLFTLFIYAVSLWITDSKLKILAGLSTTIFITVFSYLAFRQTQTWKNSMTLWQNVINNYPNSSVANNNLASEYFKIGNIERSVQLFEKAILLNPGFAEPRYGLGALQTNLKNYEFAKELLEKAIQLNPSDRTAHYNYGVWFETQSLWQQAIESYQKSVHLDPYFANGYVNLAALHLRLGKINEAKDNLKTLFEFNQNVPEAHNNFGLIYLNETNISAAILSFETAIALKPNFLSAYESLAKAYVLSGDADKAQVIIRRYLQLSGK